MSFALRTVRICDECRAEMHGAIPDTYTTFYAVNTSDVAVHMGSSPIHPKYRFDFCSTRCRTEWGNRHSRINEVVQ